MEVSYNRATPSSHPFHIGIFHEINHPAIGIPPFQEVPILYIHIHIHIHIYICIHIYIPLTGIFHETNHPAIGIPPFMETPIYPISPRRAAKPAASWLEVGEDLNHFFSV